MKNVTMTVKGNILNIEVDLGKEVGMSMSGKSMLIATTGGGVSIESGSDTKVNLSVYKKA